MEKKFQVFISSTYEDLKAERREVMFALIEHDCIPSGMEMFSATSNDQLTLIKQVIDECDYYILIIGDRYGSIGTDGRSYTETEYLYALSKNKPILAFLKNKVCKELSEESEENRNKLLAFRNIAEDNKVCNYWSTPGELGVKVSRAIFRLNKDNLAYGWIKVDQAFEHRELEVKELHERIEER